MNNAIFSLVLALLLASPTIVLAEEGQGKAFRQEQKAKVQGHRKEQQEKNKEFRAGLKDMKPEDRKKTMGEHRETRYQENKAFHQKTHERNMSFLKEKLANNKKLNDAQKTELINFFESQYQENVSYREAKHNENIAFFEKIANDSSLTQEQKKAAIQGHRQAQKEENMKHREEEHAKKKAEREKIHSEVKAQNPAAAK